MSLNIGFGDGGGRVVRSSSSGGYKVVKSLEELHAQTVIRPYIYNGEIYQLFAVAEDQKIFLHYDSDGNLYIYNYNTTTDTVAECPILTSLSVIDNLTSDIHDQPVSAAQAKILYEMVLQRITCEEIDDLSTVDHTGFYINAGNMYYCYSILKTKIYFIRFDRNNGTSIYNYDKIRGIYEESIYLNTSNIANTLTTSLDIEGKVLDARQGKILYDSLTSFQTATDLAIFNLQTNKVDKVAGKSLIADSEIDRLAKVFNYDDSAVKQLIADLQEGKVDKDGKKQLSDENFTAEEKAKLASLGNLITIKGIVDSVEKLPTVNNKLGDVYFVKKSTSEVDSYLEFIWVNKNETYGWEKLGETVNIDLSDYYTKIMIDSMIEKLMPKVTTDSLATPEKVGFYSYMGDMYFLYGTKNGIKYYFRYSTTTGVGLAQYDTTTGLYSSQTYLNTNAIVNDLNTPPTTVGKVLDARQGKVLDDRITSVYNDLHNKIIDGWEYLTDARSASAREL